MWSNNVWMGACNYCMIDGGTPEHVQELEDIVYELSVNLDTVKDTQAYMKAITNHHDQRMYATGLPLSPCYFLLTLLLVLLLTDCASCRCVACDLLQ